MHKSCLFFLLCVFVGAVVADAPVQRFLNSRSAAMGGAGITIENSMDMLLVNPALISQSSGKFQIINAKFDINDEGLANKDKVFDFFDSLNDLSKDNSKSETDKKVQITNDIKKIIPTQIRAKIGASSFPGFIAPTFIPFVDQISEKMGVGVFGNSNINVGFHSDNYIRVRARADEAMVFAFSKSLEKGFLPFDMNMGMGIKYLGQQRTYNKTDGSDEVEIGIDDLAAAATGNFNTDKLPYGKTSTSGLGIDVGFLAKTDVLSKGQFGLVIKDFGSTKLSGKKIAEVSTNIEENFSESIPMTAKIGISGKANLILPVPFVEDWLTDLTVAADYDLITPEDSFFNRIHLGVEKCVWGDLVKLRMGNNQGNMTYGVALDANFFHISYAYYTEELWRKVGVNPATYQVLETGLYF